MIYRMRTFRAAQTVAEVYKVFLIFLSAFFIRQSASMLRYSVVILCRHKLHPMSIRQSSQRMADFQQLCFQQITFSPLFQCKLSPTYYNTKHRPQNHTASAFFLIFFATAAALPMFIQPSTPVPWPALLIGIQFPASAPLGNSPSESPIQLFDQNQFSASAPSRNSHSGPPTLPFYRNPVPRNLSDPNRFYRNNLHPDPPLRDKSLPP